MNNLKQYLYDLISFPSITPNDAGSIDYIEKLLTKYGFDVTIKSFGEEDYLVRNLYARYGSSGFNLCFAGHVDVVPPGDLSLWRFDPFKAHEKDGKIHGRGAADMKGAMAAGLAAAIDFINTKANSKANFNGSISFLITSDEEGEAKYGTKKMLEYLQTKAENIDLVILGEPTSVLQLGDQVKIGRRGSINFTLEVKGVQGHVAYPQQAVNPIHILIKILNDLVNSKLDEGSEFFEKSNLEITSIDVNNSASNVIPEKAIAKFNVRFNDLQTYQSIANFVKQTIEEYTNHYILTPYFSADVFLQKPKNIMQEFIQTVQNSLNIQAIFATNGGTSDARFISKYYPVAELGGYCAQAHKINEYIKNKDLQKLYKVYYNCLCKFLY